LTFAAEAAN